MKCLLCNKEYETEKSLHIHIARGHKMRIEQYYRQFYPKFDLLTNEAIKFKDKEFYFGSLFNTRENLVTYLKNHPIERVQTILRILSLRKKMKNITYAPSSVEARTCMMPSPALVEHLKLDYNACCEKVGLQPRYDYNMQIKFDSPSPEFEIIIDTREQSPINFNCKTVQYKLDIGDYSSKSHYRKRFIERKSLSDLCGTLSQGYERFNKEILRADEMGVDLIVCVEDSLTNFLSLKLLPRTKLMKASSEFLAHRLRELCQRYKCFQAIFLKSREEMARIIPLILLIKNDISKIDLQYTYDIKRL